MPPFGSKSIKGRGEPLPIQPGLQLRGCDVVAAGVGEEETSHCKTKNELKNGE
jgi:hypothetical protein